MRNFENAFLGLILAGVLMMFVGLGLIMSLDRSFFSGSRASFAERHAIERTPAYVAPPENDKPATPTIR